MLSENSENTPDFRCHVTHYLFFRSLKIERKNITSLCAYLTKFMTCWTLLFWYFQVLYLPEVEPISTLTGLQAFIATQPMYLEVTCNMFPLGRT